MNAWFEQLNKLIALRESGQLSDDEFADHKKRLWNLQQELGEFAKEIEKEEARFAGDDVFQMRLLELQIEDDTLDVPGREAELVRMKKDLAEAVSEAEARASGGASSGTAEEAEVQTLSPEEEQNLLVETKELVEALKTEIFSLRSERLDTEFWTQSNQIEDALYRNGSEPVIRWNRRVLAQKDKLQSLKG